MDYPYLVNTLKSNLKLINDLRESTKQLIQHSIVNAPTLKGRFTTQPSKKLMTPLPKDTKFEGGRKKTRKNKKKRRVNKSKRRRRVTKLNK